MNRITIAMLVVPVFTLSAQVRPARPLPAPAPATRPSPAIPPEPPAAPLPRDRWRDEEAVRHAMELERDMMLHAREHSAASEERRLDMELRVRETRDRALADRELMRGEQEELLRQVRERTRAEQEIRREETMERMRVDRERVREEPRVPRATPDDWMGPDLDGRFLNQRPPAPWAQGDPADSLYKLAREALNRGEYRRAADLFAQVASRFPNSAYAPQCAYWEAFSRYRLGTTEELRAASRALDALASRSAQVSRETDVAGLRARIDGALAVRGDPDAVTRVRQAAREGGSQQGQGCDREDLAVRVEALNALAQMDPDGATPTLRRVLDKKDECSQELRRRAVFVLARRADATSAAMLADVARGDPSLEVRAQAIQYLMRMPGDAGLSTLEEILRTSDEERIQRAAVSALMSSDSPRARQIARALLERRDASERLRMEMLGRFERERSTPDDAAFLRTYYGRTESERLREATINALARIGGRENEDFLMAIVRNQNEPSSLRAAALARMSRMGSLTVADLAKLYDVADTRAMREQVISALANRKENEATDKLIDIARNSTDSYARKLVINVLTRRNDPRAAAALKELIEK